MEIFYFRPKWHPALILSNRRFFGIWKKSWEICSTNAGPINLTKTGSKTRKAEFRAVFVPVVRIREQRWPNSAKRRRQSGGGWNLTQRKGLLNLWKIGGSRRLLSVARCCRKKWRGGERWEKWGRTCSLLWWRNLMLRCSLSYRTVLSLGTTWLYLSRSKHSKRKGLYYQKSRMSRANPRYGRPSQSKHGCTRNGINSPLTYLTKKWR